MNDRGRPNRPAHRPSPWNVEADVAKVREALELSDGVELYPADIGKLINDGPLRARAVMFAAVQAGHARCWIAVFHKCTKGEPVGRRPFADGFPPHGWRCPTCKAIVNPEKDLRYETLMTRRV
jgi:hypothetical protein